MAKELAEEAGRLQETIRHLAHVTTGPARHSLANHKGFVLLHSWKGGLVANVEKGGGALIRVITAEDGTKTLSAPVFMWTHKVGLGVTLGVSNIHSCITLNRDSDIEAMTKDESTFGVDLDIPTYARSVKDTQQGYRKDPTLPDEINKSDKDGLGPEIFSASDSYMLVDLSMGGGGIGPHKDLNKLAYGEKTYLEILSGSVPVPPEMEILYNYIKTKFL